MADSFSDSQNIARAQGAEDTPSLAETLAAPETAPELLHTAIREVMRRRRDEAAARLRHPPARQPICVQEYPFFHAAPHNAGAEQQLRVCVVTKDFPGPIRNGGIGTFCLSLARTLTGAGHRVTVLYVLGDYCEEASLDFWIHHYARTGIDLVPLPATPIPARASPYAVRSFAVYEWLRQGDFDWIHFHEMDGYGYYSLLAKRQGLAFSNTTLCLGIHSPRSWHATHNSQYLHDIEQLEVDFLERQCARLADVVFSPSQYLLRWVQQQGWILPEDTWVLPHPLPPELTNRAKTQSSPRFNEVVFFGRLETRKGLELFCDALDILDGKDIPPLYVTFLGKAGLAQRIPSSTYLQQRAKRWRFAIKTIATSGFEEALDYLQTGRKLAVLPSVADSTSYTLYECLTLGIPVLCANSTGMPEAIAPEDCAAVLFEPNARALADKLLDALRTGASTARRRWQTDAVAADWLAFHGRPRQAPAEPLRQPLVSICVPSRNRPELLEQALQSAAHQNYPNLEVVIVDDGSDRREALDHLEALSRREWRFPVRVIRQERLYPGAARNLAAAFARGEYLLFLDDDNRIKPFAVETFVRAAERTGADFLTCFLDLVPGAVSWQGDPVSRFLCLGPAAAVGLWYNCFGDTFSLMRRRSFLALGGFTEEVGLGFEDWEFFALATLLDCRFEVLPQPLCSYRVSFDGVNRSVDLYHSEERAMRPYLEACPEPLREMLRLGVGLRKELGRRSRFSDASREEEQACLRQLFFHSVDVLFIRNRMTGFEELREFLNIEVEQVRPALVFRATTNDPQIVLPPTALPAERSLCLRFAISAPAPTELQVFYATAKNSVYCEELSRRAPLNAGMNEVFVRLPSEQYAGVLRVDPGYATGEYRIEAIEVRSLPIQGEP